MKALYIDVFITENRPFFETNLSGESEGRGA
jgi:hypothetical protein